jgi:hypothetical protein
MALRWLECEIARFDRASASVAGERTRLRRPAVRATCDG